jgi:hypothetical protein
MFKILNIREIQMKHLIYICSQCNDYIMIRYTIAMQCHDMIIHWN